MLSQLFHAHVDLHVKGLPAWMSKMNPDKMSVKDRSHVVRDYPPRMPPKTARSPKSHRPTASHNQEITAGGAPPNLCAESVADSSSSRRADCLRKP